MPARPPTKIATATAYHHLAQTMRDLESDLRWGLDGSARIPAEWHLIAQEATAPRKVPVTLRLDEDVARFFRSMGAGHLPRMNAVLRSFMLARMAGVVKGAEDVSYAPTEEEEARALRREILAGAQAEQEARAVAEAGRSDAEKRRARLEELKRLRDARGRR